MKTFQVPTAETVPASAPLFQAIQGKLGGFLPNLFATIGYSPVALEGLLTFQTTLAKGSFSLKEREAIYLVVSQVNECAYCLAAHTAILGMNKVSEDETLAIRAERTGDARLDAIIRLAADVARTRGRVNPALVDAFFAQGLDEKALIELVALVGEKSLVNYVHNLTQIPVDFPAAKPLPSAVAA